MGFLDFLFKPKVELPEDKPLFEEKVIPVEYGITTTPCEKCSNIVYTDKGVTFRENNKANPWQSYFSITKKIDGKHKNIQFHIGYFKTKEEAQKARWKFIENLK